MSPATRPPAADGIRIRADAIAILPRTLRSAAAALCALLALAVAPATAQTTFCEQDGLIVLQVESAPPAPGWAVETALPGYTGTCYYRWAGANQFANPGQGILACTLVVTTPGTYNLRVRNLHNHPDPTLENDCWARMDDGGWVKIYSPNTSSDWTWATWFDPAGGSDVLASYVLGAGTHTFQISGRSTNFRIDRLHFFRDGVQAPQNLAYPESFCPQTWTNLGQGKPGSGGLTPALTGTGTLAAGTAVTLSLAQALANAPAALVIGLAPLDVPFKGGVLVPQPTFVIGGLPTSPAGTLVLATTWPAGAPAGLGVWFQAWVLDPAATQGVSASNGLKGTTPAP